MSIDIWGNVQLRVFLFAGVQGKTEVWVWSVSPRSPTPPTLRPWPTWRPSRFSSSRMFTLATCRGLDRWASDTRSDVRNLLETHQKHLWLSYFHCHTEPQNLSLFSVFYICVLYVKCFWITRNVFYRFIYFLKSIFCKKKKKI